ncbi:unnamed protein product, partial [Sphagnum balticum]
YDVPFSPLAQPRNVIGGHVLSALVGVTCRQFMWSPQDIFMDFSRTWKLLKKSLILLKMSNPVNAVHFRPARRCRGRRINAIHKDHTST